MAKLDVARDATRRYDELLERRYLESTCDHLARATAVESSLRWDGVPTCRVLRPQFLSAATYRRVQRAATLVARGIFRVCDRLLVDAKLRRLCWLDSAPNVRLMRIEQRHRAPHLFGRLDGFLASDGSYKIIEYSGTPGGVLYGDAIAETFSTMPIMAALRRRHRVRALPTATYLLQAYRRAHADWGGVGLPRIAVVDRDFLQSGKYDEKRAIIELLRSHGFDADVVRSEQLSFRRQRLLANGVAVDAVYYLCEDALEENGEDAIIRAIEQRAAWLVVGPRSGALFSKAIFAILSDPRHAHCFDAGVAAALQKYVPWTRLVRAGRTTHRERPIDLVPFIAQNREGLVLKPALGAGGTGVVIGTECDDASWNRALGEALTIPHVVQERVELGAGVFPYLEGKHLRFAPHNAGLDPYNWNGRTARGCLVRLSRTPLLNMSQGTNTIAPLFLVD